MFVPGVGGADWVELFSLADVGVEKVAHLMPHLSDIVCKIIFS